MKDLTDYKNIEDDEPVIDKTKEQETLEPKDNTITIVLLILLTLVVGFLIWYNSKKEKE